MKEPLGKNWHQVCSVEEISENSINKFKINSIGFLLTKTGNQFKAFPPFCPHMAEPLDESGLCVNGLMTCSKHLWQWDLLSGQGRGPAEKSLLFYEIDVFDAHVWIKINEELKYDYEEDEEDDFEW